MIMSKVDISFTHRRLPRLLPGPAAPAPAGGAPQ